MIFDFAGERYLISGSNGGGIHVYDGITTDYNDIYNEVDTAYQEIYESVRTTVAIGDISGDGSPEMIVGSLRGGLTFFDGDRFDGVAETTPREDWMLYPNPSKGMVQVVLPQDVGSQTQQWTLFDAMGRTVKEWQSRGDNQHFDLSALPRRCLFSTLAGR